MIKKFIDKLSEYTHEFFCDKDGKWVIVQRPNLLLSIWIVLFALNIFFENKNMGLLLNSVLFTWAYLEVTEGASYFRRSLGLVVLSVITALTLGL